MRLAHLDVDGGLEFEISELDRSIGLERYGSDFKGTGGRIRKLLSDFVVEECVDQNIFNNILSQPDDSHPYPLLTMKKTGIDTTHACIEVEKFLRCSVRYLGLKDTRAATTQYIMLPSYRRLAEKEMVVNDRITLNLLGYIDRSISRQDLVGNSFMIRVREFDVEEDEFNYISSLLKNMLLGFRVPNFYGYQRFGSLRPVTHLVGEKIVKGLFREAVQTLLSYTSKYESRDTQILREMCEDPQNYRSVVKEAGPDVDLEVKVLKHLIERPNDSIGALRRVPIHIRRLFVNAYQSFLYNLTLSKALEENYPISRVECNDFYEEIDPETGRVMKIERYTEDGSICRELSLPLIPLIGYGYRDNLGRFGQIIKSVLHYEDVVPKSFYIREMQELSVEGGFRRASILCRAFEAKFHSSVEGGSATVKMLLAKGTYATTILRELIKPSDPVLSGF